MSLLLASSVSLLANDTEHPNLRSYVAPTVSPGWRVVYEGFPDPAKAQKLPGPDDLRAWAQLYAAVEKERIPAQERAVRAMGVQVQSKKLGGVPVLIVIPRHLEAKHKLVVYTHGGAYTMLSARSTLAGTALLADAVGLPVISIDYTNPPRAQWRAITDQLLSVVQALRKEGYRMGEIALAGDSAGGALAAGATLKMRDRGVGLPAALVLWSPWADITETGESYVTLNDAEPRFLYDRVLKPSADAYADPKEQKHPYVSPVYGDFAKGFPPTLIQGGTREIFLSNFVRLYQAIDTAGGVAKLDLYEGMPHVFQATLPDAPESRSAFRKAHAWLKKYLHY